MIINTVTKNYGMDNKLESYQVTYVNSNKIRSVPLDPANTDYQAIQKWSAIDGNNIIDPNDGD